MEPIAGLLAVHAPIIMAGVFGGITRWMVLRTHLWDLAISAFVGGTMAFYVSPTVAYAAATYLASITTDIPNIQRFSAFLTGTVGVAAVGFFIDFFRNRAKQILAGQAATPPPIGKGE